MCFCLITYKCQPIVLQFALYVNSCSRKLSLLLCTSPDIVLRDVWFAPGELWYTCTCMNGSQTQVVSLFCWVRVFFCCFWLILKSIFIKWDWCQYIDVKTILMLPFPTWSSTNILSLPSLIQRCSISGGSNKEIWVSVANVLIKVLTVIVWTKHFLICYISIIKKPKLKEYTQDIYWVSHNALFWKSWTQSMIAHMIFDWVFLEIPVKICIVGRFLTCPNSEPNINHGTGLQSLSKSKVLLNK